MTKEVVVGLTWEQSEQALRALNMPRWRGAKAAKEMLAKEIGQARLQHADKVAKQMQEKAKLAG